MAYSTANLSLTEVGGIGGVRQRSWKYESTDAATVVRVDGFISNARARGMQVGDIVFVRDTDSSPNATQIMTVAAINANGSADLSDGVAITATDSD